MINIRTYRNDSAATIFKCTETHWRRLYEDQRRSFILLPSLARRRTFRNKTRNELWRRSFDLLIQKIISTILAALFHFHSYFLNFFLNLVRCSSCSFYRNFVPITRSERLTSICIYSTIILSDDFPLSIPRFVIYFSNHIFFPISVFQSHFSNLFFFQSLFSLRFFPISCLILFCPILPRNRILPTWSNLSFESPSLDRCTEQQFTVIHNLESLIQQRFNSSRAHSSRQEIVPRYHLTAS